MVGLLFSPLVSSAADVHEKCGRSGHVCKVRLARVGMAVLVAPFSLFRFFWACKRNENRKQSRGRQESDLNDSPQGDTFESAPPINRQKILLIKAPSNLEKISTTKPAEISVDLLAYQYQSHRLEIQFQQDDPNIVE
jgi:hypothetical protein